VGSPERLADTAGFLLARAGGRAIRELNRALEPYRLRSRHYAVLALAAEHGGLPQRELGEVLAVDPSAIVALVDDLERASLVRRQLRDGDRRTRLVVVTGEGKGLLEQAQALAARVHDDLLAPLSEQERADLMGLLRRVAFG
jgi:MarR family transcriptional regulator, lower aerobic nicotinate degradation pathway regulator